MKKEDFHHEKPRYYATDFPEIMEKIPQEKRNLYPKYELLHNGSAQKASADDNATNGFTSSGNPELFGFSGNPELSDNSGSSEEQPVTLKELQKTTTDAIQLITKGRLDVQVTCPKCGSHRCFVKRSNGYFHCWICNNGGILEEMKTLNHPESSRIDGAYYARASTQKSSRQKDKNYVPMVSSDYKEINEEVRSWLYPLYPFDSEEEHQQFLEHFHSPQLAITCPKARPLLQPKEIETLQNQVKSYVQAMKLDPEVMKRTGVMCAYMNRKADDGKSEDPHGCIPVPAIAYCNYLDGKIINVKFRSVVLNPITGEWSKDFAQESPTKPCAPYGIDSINPIRPDAGPIRQLIITEGEKDRLTLMSCGFPYVLSIANGAQTNIAESHEAFEEWIAQVEEIVICGDTDRPGRTMVKALLNAYTARAKVVHLSGNRKDISDVYADFGASEVRRIIQEAEDVAAQDIYDLHQHEPDILEVMMGIYDKGYDVGMGMKTDRIFHPTSDGGLIILTGIPNSGKTDFLNCMMAHLMFQRQKRIAFFSFEKPIKAKHVREIARVALGVEDTASMDHTMKESEAREVNSQIINYMTEHMVDFDTKTRLPDSDYIIAMAERDMRKHGLDFLVIDPYVFIDMTEGGSRATETEKVRLMLTKLQAWSRTRHVWTIVVAHPRIQYKDGHESFPPLDIYSIAGSAQWANLADFLFTVRRMNKPEEGKVYSIVEMLKVRDQEFCQPGKVLYVRQPCGRYDERESEEDCIAECLQHKILPKDVEPWAV